MKWRSLLLIFFLSSCVTQGGSDNDDGVLDIDLAARLLKTEGGFTVHGKRGDLARSDLYAVSVYPEYGQKLDHLPTHEEMLSFIRKNDTLLNREENSFGGWCEGEKGTAPCYLDISRTIPERDLALKLGRACGQLSVAFLGREKVEFINVEGSGSPGEVSVACKTLRE